jgi:hypothetical protein
MVYSITNYREILKLPSLMRSDDLAMVGFYRLAL